jgi:hypothetical protein
MIFAHTIGNIRYTFDSLRYREAADQLVHCLTTARRRRLTGTALVHEPPQLPKVPDMGGAE